LGKPLRTKAQLRVKGNFRTSEGKSSSSQQKKTRVGTAGVHDGMGSFQAEKKKRWIEPHLPGDAKARKLKAFGESIPSEDNPRELTKVGGQGPS